MATVTVDRYGQQKLLARLANLEKALPRVSAEKIIEVAKEVRDEAKRIVYFNAYDTGSLHDSIRLQVYAQQAGKINRVGVSAGGYVTNPKTGRKVDYAAFVEFGTSRQRPVPFLRVAISLKMQMLRKAIRKASVETGQFWF